LAYLSFGGEITSTEDWLLNIVTKQLGTETYMQTHTQTEREIERERKRENVLNSSHVTKKNKKS
jgi:hypothetical protein